MKLIATAKMGRYKTRHLVAGEEFEVAKPRFGHLLIAIGKAKAAPAASAKPAAAPVQQQTHLITARYPSIAEKPDDEVDLVRLRDEARRRGIDVDGRWGVKRLQVEIDQHHRSERLDRP